MSKLLFRNVNRSIAYGNVILSNINIEVNSGEILVSTGLLGSGKSAVLKVVAGLENISNGDILLDNVKIDNMPPDKRRIETIIACQKLYPKMSVYENLIYSMRLKKVDKGLLGERIAKYAKILDFENILQEKAEDISEVDTQKVLLAKAAVREPKAILMIDQFESIKKELVKPYIDLLLEFNKRTDFIIIVSTTNVEAIKLLNKRTILLKEGVIIQMDNAEKILEKPLSRHAAQYFLYDISFVKGTILKIDEEIAVKFLNTEFILPRPEGTNISRLEKNIGKEVDIMLRCENIALSQKGEAEAIAAKVVERADNNVINIECGNDQLKIQVDNAEKFKVDKKIYIKIKMEDVRIFDRDVQKLIV